MWRILTGQSILRFMPKEMFLKHLSLLKVYTNSIYFLFVTALVIEIMRLLDKEPRQTPQLISEKLGKPISSVKSALKYLYELKHVKRVSHGLYEITELGEYVLRTIGDPP